jgi:hypothetical protein
MAWSDGHLHEFSLKNPATGETDVIGIPGDQFEGDPEVYAGWKKMVADYFSAAGTAARYTYDLGDNWEQTLEFEKKNKLITKARKHENRKVIFRAFKISRFRDVNIFSFF